jgi:hypothetical protein
MNVGDGEELLHQPVFPQLVQQYTSEMEFLYISLTKDSSLLLHAIHGLFYLAILKKTTLFSDLKILTKISRNKTPRVYSWIAFCRMEKWE